MKKELGLFWVSLSLLPLWVTNNIMTNNSPQVHEDIEFQNIYVPGGFTQDHKLLSEGDIDNSLLQVLLLCLSKKLCPRHLPKGIHFSAAFAEQQVHQNPESITVNYPLL